MNTVPFFCRTHTIKHAVLPMFPKYQEWTTQINHFAFNINVLIFIPAKILEFILQKKGNVTGLFTNTLVQIEWQGNCLSCWFANISLYLIQYYLRNYWDKSIFHWNHIYTKWLIKWQPNQIFSFNSETLAGEKKKKAPKNTTNKKSPNKKTVARNSGILSYSYLHFLSYI